MACISFRQRGSALVERLAVIAFIGIFVSLPPVIQAAGKAFAEGGAMNDQLDSSVTGNQQNSPHLTETQLIAIRDSFDDRVADIFHSQAGEPLHKAKINAPLGDGRPAFARNYSWSLVAYATRCFWNNENTESANDALIENADYYLNHLPELYDRDNTHWHSEMLLRLIEFYGQDGSKLPGLLAVETENRILESLWPYCKREEPNPDAAHISIADHKTTKTWAVMESENHHVQSFSTLWHFAKLAKHRPGLETVHMMMGEKRPSITRHGMSTFICT